MVDDVLHDRDLDGGGVGLGQLGHKVQLAVQLQVVHLHDIIRDLNSVNTIQ